MQPAPPDGARVVRPVVAQSHSARVEVEVVAEVEHGVHRLVAVRVRQRGALEVHVEPAQRRRRLRHPFERTLLRRERCEAWRVVVVRERELATKGGTRRRRETRDAEGLHFGDRLWRVRRGLGGEEGVSGRVGAGEEEHVVRGVPDGDKRACGQRVFGHRGNAFVEKVIVKRGVRLCHVNRVTVVLGESTKESCEQRAAFEEVIG